jgi:hypothetical protein
MVDENGNTIYGAQDGHFYNGISLNEATVSAKAPYKDGVAYSLFGDLASGKLDGGDYSPSTSISDYFGISLYGNAIVGGGGGANVNIASVEGDGTAVNAGFNTGSGLDVSAGITFTFGNYTGTDKPTVSSTSGANTYESINFGSIGITFEQDKSDEGLGQNWNYTSISIGVGTKSLPIVTGSAGVTVTSKPLYLIKDK